MTSRSRKQISLAYLPLRRFQRGVADHNCAPAALHYLAAMPPIFQDAKQLLIELESAKNRFDSGHATVIAKLLAQLSKLQFTDPHQLIRLHECLLFLRAFPHAASQIHRIESLLDTFYRRVEELVALGADMSLFDDFDTAGIAGTTMQDTLSFDVAHWLTRRTPGNVEIAWHDYWDDYNGERARGNTWPRFIPLLEEDADVEANIPWASWIDAARGRQKPLPWLLSRFAQLRLSARQCSELYDSLRLPIHWSLENLKLSRTRNWTSPRRFYFHSAPLIQRSEVSLSNELAQPAPKLEKLSLAAGQAVMRAIREIMVVRYRELYGTTLGDPRSVARADLGRGVIMHFWGLPPDRRLPLRAYIAGYTQKNGVPINYIEAIGLCEWIEVGFNTFYTYRQGETAWVYAQALRCLRALTAAKCISIYPYQIGQNNDEAIDSGAFWFYRKLGFRPARPDLQKLCEREEKRIAANSKYRTPARILKRLAEAHMFYDLSDEKVGLDFVLKGRNFSRATPISKSSRTIAGTETTGPWDTFSVRKLGMRINRRMAQRFEADISKIRQISIANVARALRINPARWTVIQQEALANWSLVLAPIPDLAHWSSEEKRQLVKTIRAKSAGDEMRYLRQTQKHTRLRAELLRLGSLTNLSH
jgi:hypothetical protein